MHQCHPRISSHKASTSIKKATRSGAALATAWCEKEASSKDGRPTRSRECIGRPILRAAKDQPFTAAPSALMTRVQTVRKFAAKRFATS